MDNIAQVLKHHSRLRAVIITVMAIIAVGCRAVMAQRPPSPSRARLRNRRCRCPRSRSRSRATSSATHARSSRTRHSRQRPHEARTQQRWGGGLPFGYPSQLARKATQPAAAAPCLTATHVRMGGEDAESRREQFGRVQRQLRRAGSRSRCRSPCCSGSAARTGAAFRRRPSACGFSQAANTGFVIIIISSSSTTRQRREALAVRVVRQGGKQGVKVVRHWARLTVSCHGSSDGCEAMPITQATQQGPSGFCRRGQRAEVLQD